ncbi:MAG: restriction endonuclease subunit S [Actinobacteria bacterium]|nr:restriction endonuclease subunit S [Actinomycetota bacterium]
MSRPTVDSGQTWIGRMPEEWSLVRLGSVFRERKTTVSDAEYEPLSVSMKGVVPRMDNVALTANNDTRKLVRAGDYVINSRSDRKGSGGIAEQDGSVSVISTVLKPQGIEPKFAHHLLRSTAFQEEFYRWGSGIVADLWSTRYSAMSRIMLPIPPRFEQREIAEYLDRETAKIDALIAKQNELIALLRERRQATITKFATQGLNPQAPMTHPSSPFIDRIPTRWTLSRFGLEVTINGGLVDPEQPPWNNMIMVAPNHVESGTGKIVGRETASEQGAESGKYLVRRGQIIYSKIRPALNKVAVAQEDCLCSADMYGMSSRKGDNHRYLMYYMLSRPFHSYASEMSARVKMPKINRDELSAAPWLRPPRDEQRQIVDRLDRETAKIDALIAKAEEHIALAQERRAALITAAVTGQLDVTGKVA